MKSVFVKIIICVFLCLFIGFLSGFATSSGVDTWFTTLNKPFFNPPNWLFAPVWTLLYTMMGIAVALVWHEGWEREDVKTAIYIFVAQLLLNGFWSIAFFGMHQMVLALIVILVLAFLIWKCIRLFRPISSLASYLLIPYLAWVSFATILNATFIYLN